jgi:uncharacterized membrane protein
MRLREHMEVLNLARLTATQWWVLAISLAVNTGMTALLAIGWRQALAGWGTAVPPRWAFSTYARTQLARYMPGNIFHFAGRQLIGMAYGIPAAALVKASATELALLVTAGCLLTLLAAPLFAAWEWLSFAPVVVILAIAVTLGGLWRMSGKEITQAFLAYLTYMAFSSLVFLAVTLTHATASPIHVSWTVLLGAYVAGWLVGVVTPGAPAGLGVREMVLLFLLRGQVAGDLLLFSVLMTRVLAVLADMLCFTVAMAMQPDAERHIGHEARK